MEICWGGDLMPENNGSYLQYLPPVLWQRNDLTPDFLERFLGCFQEIFDELDTKVDDIPKIFDPWQTPSQFVPWLASWVALELEQGWSEQTARALIHSIVSLYKIRGTLKALERYLSLYVGSDGSISLDEEREPHTFKVTIVYTKYGYVSQTQLTRQVRKILDREKPAHTYYHIVFINPTMQIGKHSTVGVDTILGTSVTG